jgi:predicted DNA-binding protein
MSMDRKISIKCSDKEFDRMNQLASRSGMPVSSYLREIGTEGHYTRRTKDKALIAEIIHFTQLCNELKDYPEVQAKLKREVEKFWQILSM